ncbi:hypothetical protein ABT095_14225 [Kitasatospora sp. NPDC002227]|uniref:hypothetical protein n=1 Tax=Kitasatospora sp. NPDC002227 TaxID=3154773 RepID=UPI00332F9A46
MISSGGIRIDLASIEQDLEDNGHDGCSVEFVPTRPFAVDEETVVLDVAEEALGAANDGGGADFPMFGQQPSLTLAGVGVSLKSYWGPDSLKAWLRTFADALEQRGFTGRLTATSLVGPPQWLWHDYTPRAGAFIALDHPLTDANDTARWCAETTDWARHGGSHALLHAGPVLQHDTSDQVPQHLARTLRTAGHGILTYIDPAAPRAAQVRVQQDGLAVFQTYDPAAPTTALVARARDAIVANADRTRTAFLTMTPMWSYGWEQTGRQPPAVDPYELRHNHPVWERRIPDVHALQLLTRAHLDQVQNLSGWTVTEVRPGRYLVEADDLTAWCAPGGPPEAVLEQARAAFGAVLATSNDLR